jgi:hypothetical protein
MNEKGFINISLLIIIITLVGIAGYWGILKINKISLPEKPPNIDSTLTPTLPSQNEVNKVDQITNDKICQKEPLECLQLWLSKKLGEEYTKNHISNWKTSGRKWGQCPVGYELKNYKDDSKNRTLECDKKNEQGKITSTSYFTDLLPEKKIEFFKVSFDYQINKTNFCTSGCFAEITFYTTKQFSEINYYRGPLKPYSEIDLKKAIEEANMAFSKSSCNKYLPQRISVRIDDTLSSKNVINKGDSLYKINELIIDGLFGDRCGVNCTFYSINKTLEEGKYTCE